MKKLELSFHIAENVIFFNSNLIEIIYQGKYISLAGKCGKMFQDTGRRKRIHFSQSIEKNLPQVSRKKKHINLLFFRD